ncbi:MAG: DUF6168 family protein [Fulvivirga sp.]|uniref:DUF6168 family protein n=1 Tax=Fulvivirga sp. TaxID=1931237 RepID=UPI0032EF6F05
MIKRLLFYNFIAALAGLLIIVVHTKILDLLEIKLPYSLQEAYIFFQLFFTLFSVFIEIVNRISNTNVGYFFLFTFLIKILVFGLKYEAILFSKEIPELSGRISLLIPMLLYIVFEAYYAVKLIVLSDNQEQPDLSE